MGDQLVETAKIREQLSHVLSELKATQSELLSMETELAVARDSNCFKHGKGKDGRASKTHLRSQ